MSTERVGPANALTRWLYTRYYQEQVRSADMSSHWSEFSSNFEVRMNEAGEFASLKGFGFGELQWGTASRRWLQNACIAAHLTHLPQRRRLLALRPLWVRTCREMGLDPTFDAFRQLCVLEFLDRHVTVAKRPVPRRVLMIGDGFGLLAALIKRQWPQAQIVMIDLGQSLLFQAIHLQKAFPKSLHTLSADPAMRAADFVYCPSDRREDIDLTFDLAVNVASMQEMDPSTVSDYFEFLRSNINQDGLFYCCNREFKRLPDGQVSAIRNYPWAPGDRFVVDEVCPWHFYYFTLRSTGRGPRVGGVPVPGVSYYDGPHLHRLAVLKTRS